MALQIGMVLFPRLTQLDLTGPYEVLAHLPDSHIHLVGKTMEPVRSERGLAIVPTTTFDTAPAIDLLFAPGGAGQIDACDDDATLAWVRETGTRARWVTSACTGALLLGCAGLLRGYRAATHWAFMDLLPLVGAIPTAERVVIDRNRITGGGVTAGIDIALAIAEQLAGRAVAEEIALQLEYPFGTPSDELRARVRAQVERRHEQRRVQLSRAPLR